MVGHPKPAGKSAARVRNVRVITIDLDDTLWAVGPVIARAEDRLKDWYRTHYPRIVEEFTRESASELRMQVFREHADRAYDLTFIRREVIRMHGGDISVESQIDKGSTFTLTLPLAAKAA